MLTKIQMPILTFEYKVRFYITQQLFVFPGFFLFVALGPNTTRSPSEKTFERGSGSSQDVSKKHNAPMVSAAFCPSAWGKVTKCHITTQISTFETGLRFFDCNLATSSSLDRMSVLLPSKMMGLLRDRIAGAHFEITLSNEEGETTL